MGREGYAALAMFLASSFTAPGESMAQPPHQKPSIIFILADDLGYGDLGSYGQKLIRTPHLDRLAAEGVRFTQLYAGSTVCAPSRCSLMTGRHTGRASIRGNADEAGRSLFEDELTVAQVLKRAGYSTGAFGKWGLGSEATPGAPWKKGFDECFGYLLHRHAHRYYTHYLWKDQEKLPLDEEKVYAHDLIIEAALDFIRRKKDEPFFLYLPVAIPHAELLVPDDSLAEYRDRFPEKPFRNEVADLHPEKRGYRSQPTPLAAFAGMVTRLDRDVGRIVARLKELGIDERTAIFFSSDNGPHQEGGADPGFFRSAGPLRGIKRDLYEGGIRVPMIARWPGKIPAGAVSDQVGAFWDFLPTAAEMAGLEPPPDLDGVSLLPALLGRSSGEERFLYWEFHERSFQEAVRLGDWKAIRLQVGRPLELYNLRADPSEERDVARDHPGVVARIEERLKKARTESPHWRRRVKL